MCPYHNSIHLPIIQVNLVTQSLRCTPDKMQWLQDLTSQDDNLVLLGEVLKQGWPQIIKDIPPDLKPFWTFHEVITTADGLLLKGNRITVPEKARKEILEQIHHGHLGIQKCLQQAKATVYWPGLYDELKTLISNCIICLKYSPANCKDSKSITWSWSPSNTLDKTGLWHIHIW